MSARVHESAAVPPEYVLEGGYVLLYRRVSDAEHAALTASGKFEPPEGGMALGKHFTCAPEYARAWGKAFVDRGWELGLGRVVRVRVAVSRASELHFDTWADGIGPQCFAPFSSLANATIEELP